MAAKVFESIGKFGLALAVAGGVVNSALYNGEASLLEGFGGSVGPEGRDGSAAVWERVCDAG